MNYYLQLTILLQIFDIVFSGSVNLDLRPHDQFFNNFDKELEYELNDKVIQQIKETKEDAVNIYCKNVYERVRMDPNTSPSQAFSLVRRVEVESCITSARFLLPKAKSVFFSPKDAECIAYFEDYSAEKFDYEGNEGSVLCEFEKPIFDKGDCKNTYPQARIFNPPFWPDSMKPGFELPLEPERTLENCIYQAEAVLPKVKLVFHSPEGECIGYYEDYSAERFNGKGSDGSTLCEIPQNDLTFQRNTELRPTFQQCTHIPLFNKWIDIKKETGDTVEFPNKATTMDACIQMGHDYEEETIQAVHWKTTGTCIGFYNMPPRTYGTDYKIIPFKKMVSLFCHIVKQLSDQNPWDPDFVEPTAHSDQKLNRVEKLF